MNKNWINGRDVGMEGRKNFAPNSPKKKPHFYYCGK